HHDLAHDAFDVACGIIGFGSGDRDQFGATEGEHHDQQCGGDPGHPVGGESAVVHQICQPGRRHAGYQSHDRAYAHHQEGQDRHDLDGGEPELHSAVVAHAEQVDCGEHGDEPEHPDPLRDT